MRIFLIAIALIAVLTMGGCQFNPDIGEFIGQVISQIIPQPTATTNSVEETGTIPVQQTPEPTVSPTSEPIGPVELTIWVPPQFDPAANTPAAKIFQEQISAFEAQNRDVFISVRVKAASGPTGLLESMAVTNAAAPDAMPSLIALPRSELESAVARNLVYPLDPLTNMIDSDDWYNYARNLTLVEGNSYGLPFAGDTMALIYRPADIGSAPANWEEILQRGEPLAFPASDMQALLTFYLYQSAGGALEDAQRHLQFDEATLTQVFQIYADGARNGAFPSWLTDLQKDNDAWTAYNELRSDWIITWSSRFLAGLPADSSMLTMPSLSETPLTLADGWVWCLADPRESVHTQVVALAEFLTQPDYLKRWAPVAGVMPVRPSSLQGWDDQSLEVLLGQLSLSAQVKPRNEIITLVGPLLEDQVVSILSGRTTAPVAAQNFIEKIGNP